MKYYVTLSGREYLVEVDGDTLRLDGTEYRAELLRIPGTPLRVLRLDGRSHLLAARRQDGGRWELLYDGEIGTAEVLDERRRHIREMVGTGREQTGAGTVKAPMPGLVVRLLVEEGTTVEPGSGLLVLEAMKMENELKAHGRARVQRILAQPGQAVEKGEALIELGPAASD